MKSGWTLSDEQKHKISVGSIGRKMPTMTEEARHNMSEASKRRYKRQHDAEASIEMLLSNPENLVYIYISRNL